MGQKKNVLDEIDFLKWVILGFVFFDASLAFY